MARFYVGTSGWTYSHWKGSFYPPGLAQSRWFEHYAARFNAVEINATFYRLFSDSTYTKWREQAGADFRYALKAPRAATHEKLLLGCEEELAAFARSSALLEERLGMFLLQVAPSMPFDLPRLQAALQAFPDPTRVAVEFRAEIWRRPAARELLERLGAAYVSVDSPAMRPTGWLTGPRAYVRLHGRAQMYASNYSDAELAEFAALAQSFAARGAAEVYIFFNNDVGGFAPWNALVLQEMLLGG